MADVLNADALHHALDQLPGWQGTTEKIVKTYEFADFLSAMRFVNLAAEQAEALNHHPDILIRYNRVTLELSTHSAGGVTQQDTDLAAKLEGLSTA